MLDGHIAHSSWQALTKYDDQCLCPHAHKSNLAAEPHQQTRNATHDGTTSLQTPTWLARPFTHLYISSPRIYTRTKAIWGAVARTLRLATFCVPATRAKQSLVVSNVRKSSSVASKGRFPMNKGNFFPWLVSLHAFQNGANTASIVISCPYMKSKMRNRG